MYKVSRLPEGLIRVHEILISPTKTKHKYIYIDTVRWLTTGVGGIAVSDPKCVHRMTPAGIEWAKKHYLSKLGDAQESPVMVPASV